MRGPFLRGWICVAIFCGAAQAADKFPWEADAFSSAPEATLKAAAQLASPENAEVDILLDEMKFEFDASRRVRKTWHRMYRLLNKEALDDWSVITAEWSGWHEERPQIQVRVISTDGQAHTLDAKTISESPVEQSGQVFRDRRRLVAPLPAVEVGAVVEWQTVIAEHRAFCEAGVVEEHFFHSPVPIRSMRLIVEAPEQGPPLHHRVRGIELTPKRSVENGLVRLEFGPVPVGVRAAIEGFLPTEMPLVPHAVIGNGNAWADLAQHYAKIVDRQIGEGPYAEIARNIVGDEKSRLGIVRKLLEDVQKRVRYVGIEFGESSIVPHTPPETLKVRYGDCKDQSTLLVALLRSLGHPAHVALLRVGRREDLLPDVPALNVFDHAIVHVPGDPELWIDPTAPLFRVGELPVTDLGRLALVAAPATKDLVRTPQPQSSENLVIRTRELVLASENHGLMRESIEYQGLYENQIRSYYAESKPEDLRKGLEQQMKQGYGADRVLKFEYGDPRDLTARYRVSYEADGVNYGLNRPTCSVPLAPEPILDDIPWFLRQYGQRRKPGAKSTDEAEDRWERTAPLQFPRPFVKELRYRVILPIGFSARRLPDSFSKQFGPATISASFAAESENLIAATFRFDSGIGRLSPDEAKALRTFLGQLHDDANGAWAVPIFLQHTASQHIAQGHPREGFLEYQRLMTKHPADVEIRTFYTESLVSAGMGAAARDEARKATELDPNSADAWQMLGYARMHDDFGRFMGPGCDALAAQTALKRAVEIDPKAQVARWNLAVALEYGSGTRRYALGPLLKEAADHYRTLRTQKYQQPELPVNLLFTLVYSDNWQEVISLSGELQPSLLRNAMWVAAVAATENVAAAKTKALELGDSDEVRRNILFNASDVLNNARRYATSAELLEHSLPLIAEPELRKRIQDHAAGVKGMSRMDETLLPRDDPRRLVQQLHVAAFSGSAAESVSPLFVEEAGPEDVSAALESILAVHGATIRTALKSNKTSERIGDIASLVELKSEGDAEAGYRVSAGNMRWYVVQRAGELRLLPPGLDFSELGREALRHLDAGDEAGARRWLEWAAVELPAPKGFFVDPFSASPFGFLWNVLKQNRLKTAAAILAAPGGKSDEALQILSEFQQAETPKSQLLHVDRTLARAYIRRSEWERVLEIAQRVQPSYKSASEPRQWKLLALLSLNRVGELNAGEEQHPTKVNDSAQAWAEGFRAAKRGDFDLSQKLLRPLADDPSAKADPQVFNELAWNALFRDEPPTEAALADAVKANAATNYRTTEYLHTLATVHAELGQGVEARKFLMQAIDARDGKTEHVDLYVLGRIAEGYGLKEIAARHYAQVERDEAANSTYNLAQRGLKRLQRQ